MNKNELKILVQRAITELSPMGVEHAWENIDGTVIKWSDILSCLEDNYTTPINEVPANEVPVNEVPANEVVPTLFVNDTPVLNVEGNQ